MKEKINVAWLDFCAKMTGLLLLAGYGFGFLSLACIVEQAMLKNGKGVFFCIMTAFVCAAVIYYLYATGAVKRAEKVEKNDFQGAYLDTL